MARLPPPSEPPAACPLRADPEHDLAARPPALAQLVHPADLRQRHDRLEIHHTPKHGSWLNVAEIELAVLQWRCLCQRFGDRAMLEREVTAWADRRNATGSAVDWRFTPADARTKLERLSPANEA